MDPSRRNKGIQAAAASAVFLGLAPIFGKQAIIFGFTPLCLIAFRTGIALLLLLVIMIIFQRQAFYIYFVGLIGCFMAGFVNGLGSILYYIALSRLDASIGHLLYSFYPLFVAFWLLLDRQTINHLTAFRLALSIPGVLLLVSTGQKSVDIVGAVMMLASGALYALHLLINQRILFEVPAPTVTLYTLLSMSLTVIAAFLLFHPQLPAQGTFWWPIWGMAFFTFFSRITLFLGVKHLGGLQTAILGLGELLVTVLLAQLWLGERLSFLQWFGAALLACNLLLVGFDKIPPQKRSPVGWLSWLNPPEMRSTDVPWQS
jgi:drug/metabolite transporter (DMT)-like permease